MRHSRVTVDHRDTSHSRNSDDHVWEGREERKKKVPGAQVSRLDSGGGWPG